MTSQWARKFKKVQAKKLVKSNNSKFFFSWNCIFPNSKVDFWPFLKLQKMEFGLKKIFFREIDLFDFTNFLDWTSWRTSSKIRISGTRLHYYYYICILPRLHKSGSFSSLDICKFVAISTKRLKSTGKIDEAKNSCHSSITLVWVVHDTNRHTWCTNAQTDWANFEHWKKRRMIEVK